MPVYAVENLPLAQMAMQSSERGVRGAVSRGEQKQRSLALSAPLNLEVTYCGTQG